MIGEERIGNEETEVGDEEDIWRKRVEEEDEEEDREG
jgi:hypothetical protein